jgi:hypothetical protein
MRSVSPSTSPFHFPRLRAGGFRARPIRKNAHVAQASVVGATTAIVLMIGMAFPTAASAASPVQLGTAAPFAVLAGSGIADVPTSSIIGDVGLSPAAGTNITGLTPAEVSGTIYAPDATGPGGTAGNNPGKLTMAKHDLTLAYVAAQNLPATKNFGAGDNQLGGKTLVPGVYAFGGAATANITAASPLVLNGEGSYDSVFVFQASSTLVTAAGSVVRLENGAQACNVFWQVTSSATLGSSSSFVGTIMALTTATLDSTATVQGRVLARNAAVNLDANTIIVPSTCKTGLVATTTTTTSSPGSTSTTAPGATSTTSPGGSGGTAAGTAGTTGTGTGTGATPAAGGSTTSGATGAGGTGVVPAGFPHTGLGGAAHSSDRELIVLGAVILAGAAGAISLAVRRRRLLPDGVRTDGRG